MLKRILCALLASMILMGTLVSCGNPDETDKDSENSKAETTNEATETREPLEVPDITYPKTELCFLTRDEGEWSTVEICPEEKEGNTASDNISSAVFERNDRILQNYEVTIIEQKKLVTEHTNLVNREISAPTGEFQAIISNVTTSAAMTSQNLLWDLNSTDVEYINLEKSWWDNRMAEGMSIDNKVCFATGDLLTADNDATFAILFNKKLVKDFKIPDLYAIVENQEWTMDAFYQYSKEVSVDKVGDGKLDYDSDTAGFAYTNDAPYCFLFGSGITMCTKDATTDTPIYSLNIERAQNVSDKAKLIFSNQHSINMSKAVDGATELPEVGKICFGGNHALFFGEVMQAVTRMREYDVDFGILPFPMYDKTQGTYLSMMHYTASMVSIPRSVADEQLEMVNAMIEAMAYHSVDTLTVEYYDVNLKTKAAKDEQSGPMIDKILASRACDLAYYYNWGRKGAAYADLANCLMPDTSKSVSSVSKTYQSTINSDIRKLLNILAKD